MSDQLRAAAGRLRETHGRALGALDASQAMARSNHDVAVRDGRKRKEQREAVVRSQAAQAVIEHSLSARDLATSLGAGRPAPLAVAEYVDLGRLTMRGSPLGVNEEVTVPLLVPLLGHGNLVIEADAATALPLVHSIVWQALTHTAPGQLNVIAHDPRLTSALSPFSALRNVSGDALRVSHQLSELEQIVHQLVSDVQRINDRLRGGARSLVDFHRSVGHPLEQLQLVVLLDYQSSTDEALHTQLLAVARAGANAGISFIIVTAPGDSAKPDWWRNDDVRALGAVFREEHGALVWSAHPSYSATIRHQDIDSIAHAVGELAQSANAAAAQSIPFVRVQPPTSGWEASSAERITFAIGLDGSEVAELTLGDERDQRHNILITGAVGQGKSNLLKVIIHSLAERYAPEELELHLLDFKEGVTLYPMAPRPGAPDFLPHARVLGLESDRDFGLAVLRHLEAEFARRAKLFRPYGDSISRYRAAVPQAVMPRIVLIIDEFHMLFDPNDATAETAAQLLEALARRGRSYGVHLILASQTVSGISALMAREGGIYAQFPIRLALKNAVQESFATLGQGNDAAARLRIRGQAIVNLDYGNVESNRHVLVAAGNDEEFATLRHQWWTATRARVSPPLVFDGSQRVRPADSIPSLQGLRAVAVSRSAPPAALVGYPITVSGRPIAVPLGPEPGRNLAILGAGEDAQATGSADAENNAIGVLHAAGVSLALQHPAGDAEFVSFEMLDEPSMRRNNHEVWLQAMAQIGFTVERIGRDSITDYLQAQVEGLERRNPATPAKYLLGFGMDRAAVLDTPDAFAHRPSEDLQQVLRAGPSKHVHVLGWWANAATFRSHIGFGGEGFIDAVLILRLDQSTTQDVLSSPFVTWSVKDNRGLLSDRTQLAEPTTVIPFSPMTPHDATLLAQADWEVTP